VILNNWLVIREYDDVEWFVQVYVLGIESNFCVKIQAESVKAASCSVLGPSDIISVRLLDAVPLSIFNVQIGVFTMLHFFYFNF